ncbi:MAG: NUDIX domain-containing protein [Clostridia bacterium]|nr:NUDIX domain-containing protein [Clostridia bacterium]MBR3256004.1 NUDIX domain-containing protein [Clostridia bacterium]
MIKKRIRVAAILPMNDGLAFMHRTEVKNHPIGDYYTFPGGGLEENETLEEGVKREIQEEFGIEVEVQELLYQTSNSNNSRNILTEEYFFLCKYISGEFGTGDGPEFSNNPKYADRGKYIPEIVAKEDIDKIKLLPDDVRELFINDLKIGKI